MSTLVPGTVLQDRYEIVGPIGQGGMGAVYEAVQGRLKRRVAVKQLLIAGEARRSRAFLREAQILANLEHRALPDIIDYFTDEAGHFLVMDFVPGNDLAMQLAQRQAPFAVELVLQWANEVLDVLHYLHTQPAAPIYHGDIKPHNLKLRSSGEIMVLDFGLAKGYLAEMTQVSAESSIVGYTPGYSPPEQVEGSGTDGRSDLYALGATLHQLLTYSQPIDERSRWRAVVRGQHDPLRPAHELNALVPPEVSAVLVQALALERDERPASAAAMRDALKAAYRSLDPTFQAGASTARAMLPVAQADATATATDALPWAAGATAAAPTRAPEPNVRAHVPTAGESDHAQHPTAAPDTLGGAGYRPAAATYIQAAASLAAPQPATEIAGSLAAPALSAIAAAPSSVYDAPPAASGPAPEYAFQPDARPDLPPVPARGVRSRLGTLLGALLGTAALLVLLVLVWGSPRAALLVAGLAPTALPSSAPTVLPSPGASTAPLLLASASAVRAPTAAAAANSAAATPAAKAPSAQPAATALASPDSAACIQAAAAAAGDAEQHLQRGQQAFAAAQYEAAIGEYSRALELDTRFVEALISRGQSYHMLGKYECAVDDYTRALQLEPQSVVAYNFRGNAYANQQDQRPSKDYTQAIADYTRAIELSQQQQRRYAAPYRNRALVRFAQQDYAQAISDYTLALEQEHDQLKQTAILHARGQAYFANGQDQPAIDDFDRAIARDQNFAAAYFDRGLAYKHTGGEPAMQRAVADFQKVLQLSSEPELRQKAEQELRMLEAPASAAAS